MGCRGIYGDFFCPLPLRGLAGCPGGGPVCQGIRGKDSAGGVKAFRPPLSGGLIPPQSDLYSPTGTRETKQTGRATKLFLRSCRPARRISAWMDRKEVLNNSDPLPVNAWRHSRGPCPVLKDSELPVGNGSDPAWSREQPNPLARLQRIRTECIPDPRNVPSLERGVLRPDLPRYDTFLNPV